MSDVALKKLTVPAHYLLLADLFHMTLAALLLCQVLFAGTEIPFIFQLIITGLIIVVLMRGGSWLVLGAMQVSMFFYEPRVAGAGFQFSTVFSGVLCLALIAYAAGFRHVRRLLREWLGRLFYLLLNNPSGTQGRSVLADLDMRREHVENWVILRGQSLAVLRRCLRLLAIVVIASIAFLQMPFTLPGITAWWKRSIEMGYQLWPGPFGFTVTIVCLLIMSFGSWRRLNALQARLYLKSTYVREHFRELRSILVRGGYLR